MKVWGRDERRVMELLRKEKMDVGKRGEFKIPGACGDLFLRRRRGSLAFSLTFLFGGARVSELKLSAVLKV